MLEAILRIVHIFVGVFLVGYYFTMLIVAPAASKLGPDALGRLANLMRPVLEPVMLTATFVIVGTGVVVLRDQFRSVCRHITTHEPYINHAEMTISKVT